MKEKENQSFRKIIHIDMDAFYASVEQRDFPEYRGKPIAVGGLPSGRGGVVAAASYEARKYGVHSAMPSKRALQLCPHLIFVKPRFEVYKSVSLKVREIFRKYTDLIEPLSLDEAYLDVSEDKVGIGSAIKIAQEIRKTIKNELQLTASAGISVNKFVAKVASDMDKPDGLTFIGPSKIEDFMEVLPIEKFYGVGKVTATKMRSLQIYTGADLKKLTEEALIRHFGKQGRFFYNIVRGIDTRLVQAHRESKSVGIEDTFSQDLSTQDEMEQELTFLAEKLTARIKKHQLKGRTVTVKIRFNDFSIITRSRSFQEKTDSLETIQSTAIDLLVKELFSTKEPNTKKVRLLGITLSNFYDYPKVTNNPYQLTLF